MKVIKKYDQHRRDLVIDLECEGCGNVRIGVSAYDDRNFWDNVVPKIKCKKCGEDSTNRPNEFIQTRYPEGFQV